MEARAPKRMLLMISPVPEDEEADWEEIAEVGSVGLVGFEGFEVMERKEWV